MGNGAVPFQSWDKNSTPHKMLLAILDDVFVAPSVAFHFVGVGGGRVRSEHVRELAKDYPNQTVSHCCDLLTRTNKKNQRGPVLYLLRKTPHDLDPWPHHTETCQPHHPWCVRWCLVACPNKLHTHVDMPCGLNPLNGNLHPSQPPRPGHHSSGPRLWIPGIRPRTTPFTWAY